MNKRQIGWLAKARGDSWQDLVRLAAIRQNIACEIIYDGAKRTGRGGYDTVFMTQICDMILGYQNKLILCDAKERSEEKLLPSSLQLTSKGKRTSTGRQVESLYKWNKRNPKHLCGFLVHLTKSKRVVWAHAYDVIYAEPRIEIRHTDVTLPNSSLPDFKKLFSLVSF